MDEIIYEFVDERGKEKSVATFKSVRVDYWAGVGQLYGQDVLDAYIKAVAYKELGEHDKVLEVIAPHVSGENTLQTSIEEVDGELVTVITGEDTRSELKKWYEANYN